MSVAAEYVESVRELLYLWADDSDADVDELFEEIRELLLEDSVGFFRRTHGKYGTSMLFDTLEVVFRDASTLAFGFNDDGELVAAISAGSPSTRLH